MYADILKAIADAGVVGAGGAGFPTHVKLKAKAELVIANGCECEPLIQSDKRLMQNEAGGIVSGLVLAMETVGAKKGIIAVKAKNTSAINILSKFIQKQKNISLFKLRDYYPIGDEQLLVYEVSGKLVPPGGIPLAVGVVVCNVATLYNIAKAQDGIPVTHRYVSIAGEVAHPKTVSAPIGITISELIVAAGGALVDNPALIIGGPMMGRLSYDLQTPVIKTTGAVLVLDSEHPLVVKKSQRSRHAASLCCQCGACTQICPRQLLGYQVEPDKIMNKSGYSYVVGLVPEFDPKKLWVRDDPEYRGLYDKPTQLVNKVSKECSDCNLCGAYACFMGISPMYVHSRLKQAGAKPTARELRSVHPLRAQRYVPTTRLISRLGLREFNVPIPYNSYKIIPKQIKLLLKQHIGAPATAVVEKGQLVKAGQLAAKIPAGSLGANLHSPIDGVVQEIKPAIVIKPS